MSLSDVSTKSPPASRGSPGASTESIQLGAQVQAEPSRVEVASTADLNGLDSTTNQAEAGQMQMQTQAGQRPLFCVKNLRILCLAATIAGYVGWLTSYCLDRENMGSLNWGFFSVVLLMALLSALTPNADPRTPPTGNQSEGRELFRIKVTLYRITETAVSLALVITKCILTYRSRQFVVTTLDFIIASATILLVRWMDRYEVINPPIWGWWFHTDYSQTVMAFFTMVVEFIWQFTVISLSFFIALGVNFSLDSIGGWVLSLSTLVALVFMLAVLPVFVLHRNNGDPRRRHRSLRLILQLFVLAIGPIVATFHWRKALQEPPWMVVREVVGHLI